MRPRLSLVTTLVLLLVVAPQLLALAEARS